MRVAPGTLTAAIDALVPDVEGMADLIWARDHTVWQDDPTEVSDRLGWLDSPGAFASRLHEFTTIVDGLRADGIDRVLLVGMGGSSLYPEVLARTAATPSGLDLTILDTTHPTAVARARADFDPQRTLLVASSKSGGTIETRSHLERFWADLVDALGADEAGRHVVAITDPGSALAELGEERGFRAVVLNPPDIGGRFSALSAFGLLPAALVGVDVEAHLSSAQSMLDTTRAPALADNHALHLGVVMAAAAQARLYGLSIHLPEPIAAFGDWIEQLVAESTGKLDTGLLPVLRDPLDPTLADRRLWVVYGEGPEADDLIEAGAAVVVLPIADAGDLGSEVIRWEFATAVCGALLGMNPFDQPNVQSAKTAAGDHLASGDPVPDPIAAQDLLAGTDEADYVAVLAFADPDGDVTRRAAAATDALAASTTTPVTFGVGPRYLHSTGQLHKGGPVGGIHVVVVEDPTDDVDVPGNDHTFGALLTAQAAGDLAALGESGRVAGRVTIDDLEAAAR